MAHILLIEDNLNNAEYIIRILTGVGHEVEHYEKGLEGSRATRRRRPDLILLDFNLPDIDGNVLILSIKKNLGGDAAPPIIAVTARNSAVDRHLAQQLGFSAFIGKPFEPDELLNVINTILKTLPEDNKG
jgi:DNA-binding response OmpR family regulator